MKPKHKCTAPMECAVCKYGEETIQQWETDQLIRQGWYMHFIIDDGSVHTHGIADRWGHPDLEIMLPLEMELLASILHTVVDRIKKGERFEAGKRYRRVIKGYWVAFVKAMEGGRGVLRLILPDQHGNISEDEIEEGPFKDQYIGALK